MPDIINFEEARERIARYRNIQHQNQEPLGLLYLDLQQYLGNEQPHLDPDLLERFLLSALTDHLMEGFQRSNNVHELAQRYNDFETRLRRNICHRLTELNSNS